jgi:hypothetical protein
MLKLNSFVGILFVLGVLALLYSTSASASSTFRMLSMGPAPMTPDQVPGPKEGFTPAGTLQPAPTAPASMLTSGRMHNDPSDLLPSPSTPAWGGDINPSQLLAGNFMDPGRMSGVNQITRFKTVPNLQLRSDPPISGKFDSPYNQTPDLVANPRPEFEIGRRPDYPSLSGYSTGRS